MDNCWEPVLLEFRATRSQPPRPVRGERGDKNKGGRIMKKHKIIGLLMMAPLIIFLLYIIVAAFICCWQIAAILFGGVLGFICFLFGLGLLASEECN